MAGSTTRQLWALGGCTEALLKSSVSLVLCSSTPLPLSPYFSLLVLADRSPPWRALKLTYFPNVTSKEGPGANHQHGASPHSPSCSLSALDQIHPATLWREGLLPRSSSQLCRRPGPASSSILLLRRRLISSGHVSHLICSILQTSHTPPPLQKEFCFYLSIQLSCLLFLFS